MNEKKKLGRFDIFSMGVGGAIGSGIFVLLGIGIMYTGKSISLAVLVGCLYMLLAYFYHLVMSSMFVLPGGDYDAKALLMSPLLTGVSAVFIIMGGMAMAAYGIAVVEYTGMIFPSILPYTNAIALVIMALFFLATVKGTKFVSILVNIMTIVLLASLAMFVIFGLGKVQSGYFTDGEFFSGGALGFINAIAFMGFACQGTTMGPVALMKDTKNARKIVPSTILLISLTVGIVYALIAIVASGVLPIDQVAGANLSVVAEAIFPYGLFVVFIFGGAVFAISTSMLGGIQMLRYPCAQVCDDGWMPKVFTKRTANDYPWAIMLLFFCMSALPLVTGLDISEIISLVMIPTMLLNGYINLKLIVIIKEYPDQWKESTMHMPNPIYYALCVISSVCALSVAYFLFKDLSTKSMIMCGGIIVVCVGVAALRLQTGAVSKDALIARRTEIAKKAIEYTLNED